MQDDNTRTDFPCFHDPLQLCRKCEYILKGIRRLAEIADKKEANRQWPEAIVAKLKLIQDLNLQVTIRESRSPLLPPLPPFPDCDLCGEPGTLTTPEAMTFCGRCWRAHRAVQDGSRHFGRIEAGSLIPPEDR